MNATIRSLRFVFVMMIFMSHFGYADISAFDAGGDCGVAFFFLLSGFALSMGYGSRIDDGVFSYRHFMKRRLLKVYPLHLLSLVLLLVLFHPEIGHKLLLNALLLQSWIPDANYYFSYNGVSWFLSSLLFHYLLFPVVWKWANRFTLIAVVAFCAAAYVLVPYGRITAVLYVAPWMRFVDFFLGVVLYKLYRRSSGVNIPGWTEWFLVALLAASLASYPFVDAKLRNAPLYWCVLLPLIFVFVREKGPVTKCLRCCLFQWLGSLSMPIFMLHPIVLRSMFHFFKSMPYAVMLALCFAITVALSWVVDRFLLSRIDEKLKS